MIVRDVNNKIWIKFFCAKDILNANLMDFFVLTDVETFFLMWIQF